MALSISEACAVNTLLDWLTGQRTIGLPVPTAEEAQRAADLLCAKAYKTLMSGRRPPQAGLPQVVPVNLADPDTYLVMTSALDTWAARQRGMPAAEGGSERRDARARRATQISRACETAFNATTQSQQPTGKRESDGNRA